MTATLPPKYNDDGEYIFSVSELNATVADLLDRHFGEVLVQGEISGLKQYSSGHIYFTLKDPRASIRCVLFRGKQFGLTFIPQDGDQVTLQASLSIYPERGDFQLIVNRLERAGVGNLQQQFLLLKQKLEQAGLFAAGHKKPIPTFPKQIGVITSPDGAALHDVLTVLKRRFPTLPVRVYAAQVQGEAAPKQLIRALEFANRENCCDVLLLTRGGGSLEDLWAFNDEALAHAIFNSTIPIVSAVGHEVDFSIADFVADQRAPTPSAGAELISPDRLELNRHLNHLLQRLEKQTLYRMQQQLFRLNQLRARLKHPQEKLLLKYQHLDTLMLRLQQLIHNLISGYHNKIRHLNLQLQQRSPERQLQQIHNRLSQLTFQLHKHALSVLESRKSHLAALAGKLDVISPLATLRRGYGIAQDPQQRIISSIHAVDINEKITIQLSDGKLGCRVINKQK